ncbi:MAG: adenosylhomocysteinase [Elusimicrobiota bacterium]
MSDINDVKLASQGRKRIKWADNDMPVLAQLRERFKKETPLEGINISCCLHVTAETANLMRTLKEGGADVLLCASNPLSTQDDVAASLVEDFKIKVFARNGEDTDTFYKHIQAAVDHDPLITMDDGADLVKTLHSDYPEKCENIYGSMEETTTGVIRLKAMERDEALKIPVIAVNDARTKNLFDNRYGTGQSTLDGIIRATDILLAGKNVVTAGYGWCGRGFAMRARGMGANVIVTEVDPVKAIEAVMDGFRVMPMDEASGIGDLFCTLTGDIKVIDERHFKNLKDGAIICNSGHFDVEINIDALEKMAVEVNKEIRPSVDEYVLEDGRKINLIAQGRLVNLAAAEGHPASVMDMSFSTQALASKHVAQNKENLEKKVYNVSKEIEEEVAELKLKSMDVEIDELTPEQEEYLNSWDLGT